ncbi:hypothetical protein CC78DRAFT_527967 [Lojkania enalia]|uniref:Uncharacterized protein n=1 Tax=Lojkania enalia TaxID=147567 RepID=A0A9P4ND33_9PLEO|nr:hypothetical protein CC78DRAFT_527967 [Didymosphaeria enalia]
MATNAPYFQLRGQYANSTNGQFAPVDDEYDLSASISAHNASLYVDVPSSHNQNTTLEENHNLVELLEAATTAAGEATHAMNVSSDGVGKSTQNKGKRKRTSSPLVDEASADTTTETGQGSLTSSNKRTRRAVPTDPQLQGEDSVMHQASLGSDSAAQSSSESLLVDARAAGVHSAVALFRKPSKETTRKYTRPPMSKLFMSLQILPENFLHLQARAKTYMLDPTHPERQSCVGSRGKGDTDMVKLRLFNCVRDFLDDGIGEQFFGEHVERPGGKDAIEAARALGQEKAPSGGKLVWPRDGNKIISLVTPLLRRMVTNERQRMYAIETRKGGAKKKEGSAEATQVLDSDVSCIGDQDHQLHQLQTAFDSATSYPITQNSAQEQHSHSASPLPSFSIMNSINPHQASTPIVSMSLDVEDHELKDLSSRSLPTQNTYALHSIRIQLAKNNIKLKPRAKVRGPFKADYTLADLKSQIKPLVQDALAIYADLKPSMGTAATEETVLLMKGMGPEALRGLAVAATEIQSHANETLAMANDDDIEERNNTGFRRLAANSETVSGPSRRYSSGGITLPPNNLPPVSQESPVNTRTPQGCVGLIMKASDAASTRAIAPNSLRTSTASDDYPSIQRSSDQPCVSPKLSTSPVPRAMARPSVILGPKGEHVPLAIRAMTTVGLIDVNNEDQWKSAMIDVGYSVWATGMMHVVVDLL